MLPAFFCFLVSIRTHRMSGIEQLINIHCGETIPSLILLKRLIAWAAFDCKEMILCGHIVENDTKAIPLVFILTR